MDDVSARRPLASRSTGWAIALSGRLARTSVTPNQISVVSVAFAAAGATLIGLVAHPAGWIAAAVLVQLRLVCNLLDGMVAIEGGKKSPVGGLYNEIPDRIADSLLLVAAGYAAGLPWVGWLAALAAVATAYVRALGGTLGLPQDFSGVMSKPRRMAALTAGLVAQSVEWAFADTRHALAIAIAVIAAGGLWTCVSRTRALAQGLRRP